MELELKSVSVVDTALEPLDELYDAVNEKDQSTAAKLLRPLAENGNATAQYELGVRYDFGEGVRKNHKVASKWYLLAAKQGIKEAQLEIGLMYGNGQGVRRNRRQAVRWLLSAARQGDEWAHLVLNMDYSIYDFDLDPDLFR
jgi:TPR repeat protein